MVKIKVLHIIKSLGRGGAETLLPETLALHDQNRFEWHYAYFLPWKNQMVEAIEEAGGKVVCFQAGNHLRILLSCRKIIRYVRANDIDIIHAHLPWAGFVARIVHKLTGTPLIYTEHNKQERYHKITFALNKFTFNWQSMVVAVSGDVEGSIRKNIKPEIEIKTILNGVNVEKFKPGQNQSTHRKALGIPEDAIVVGTVAVFRFQKRLAEWMQVMKAVLEVNDKFYGVIVGDGPLREVLLEERKRLGLEKRVVFAGLQTEVRPWLEAFDIYMMTSAYEGLPIALLEAMSMECAIVTTDAGGIKEVITKPAHGTCVGVNDWPSLSEAVLSVSDPGNAGKNARKRVVEAFNLKTMVRQLESLYLDILAKK